MNGTSAREIVLQPGSSVEQVEGAAQYMVLSEGREISIQEALQKYESGAFVDALEATSSSGMHNWRVWIALPFSGGGEVGAAPMRRVIGLGGIFVEPPRVFLICGGVTFGEILASKTGEGRPLSARYFTYLRTQTFDIDPGQRCVALINASTFDNPNIGIFREGELGTNQVAAVLLKGGFSATLLIVGLILAITAYLTDRPLGMLIGFTYSVTMLQNEASLFTTTFIDSPLRARAVWESMTVLSIFMMTYVFLYGFRKELRLTHNGVRRLVSLLLIAPIVFIAYRSNATPDIIWAFYLGLFLFAVTVTLRLDIAPRLRFSAGSILIVSAVAALFVEPYYLGRHLSDLAIEFVRDMLRFSAGAGMLLLLLVDVLQSRRARARLVEERIAVLEKQSETDRVLLETERKYASAREAATLHKAQLANASHDIRQPLAGLRAALRYEGDRLSAHLKSRLDESLDYLETLTNEYSDRSGADGDDPSSKDDLYSLELITRAVNEMFADEAREARVAFEIENEACETRTPALALIRATSNLIANALRHADARKITLKVDCGERCRIIVEDDGKGMDETTLAMVMQAGGKSSQSDGDGLGLAIVSDLATRHGFVFTMKSSPGQGTKAVLELPHL